MLPSKSEPNYNNKGRTYKSIKGITKLRLCIGDHICLSTQFVKHMTIYRHILAKTKLMLSSTAMLFNRS